MLLNSAVFVANLNNLLKESVIISSLHAFTVTHLKEHVNINKKRVTQKIFRVYERFPFITGS